MTLAVPMLSHPLSRITSRLPHLPRSYLWEGHPCPDYTESVGGASLPRLSNHPVGGASLPRLFRARTRKREGFALQRSDMSIENDMAQGLCSSGAQCAYCLNQDSQDLRIYRIKDKETHARGRGKHLWEGHLPIQPAPMLLGEILTP